jgi:hypothetical protein
MCVTGGRFPAGRSSSPCDDQPTDELCVLCSEPAADGQEPVVVWMTGALGETAFFLYWHAGCAGSFVLRLGRDAWQLEHDRSDHLLDYRDRR